MNYYYYVDTDNYVWFHASHFPIPEGCTEITKEQYTNSMRIDKTKSHWAMVNSVVVLQPNPPPASPGYVPPEPPEPLPPEPPPEVRFAPKLGPTP